MRPMAVVFAFGGYVLFRQAKCDRCVENRSFARFLNCRRLLLLLSRDSQSILRRRRTSNHLQSFVPVAPQYPSYSIPSRPIPFHPIPSDPIPRPALPPCPVGCSDHSAGAGAGLDAEEGRGGGGDENRDYHDDDGEDRNRDGEEYGFVMFDPVWGMPDYPPGHRTTKCEVRMDGWMDGSSFDRWIGGSIEPAMLCRVLGWGGKSAACIPCHLVVGLLARGLQQSSRKSTRV